ncbi:MAG TPA: MoaD/ThiS family protein [Acidimicrobiales bacterium]|nr:MoaD/ThiS family protein [Acidimicrobiales bacterium]
MTDRQPDGSAADGAARPGSGPATTPAAPAGLATLLLFGPARQAAGTARAKVEPGPVDELCRAAALRFGPRFTEVLAVSSVWVNGEPAPAGTAVAAGDEVAVVPPISGGA